LDSVNSPDIRQVLQSELIQAMRNQDRQTMTALRSVLSAIANKEAVPAAPTGSIEEPVFGHGDVPRRELTAQEVKLVVLDEVEARRNSAGYMGTAGRHEEAAALEAEALILERYLYLI